MTPDHAIRTLRVLGFRTLKIDLDALLQGLEPEDWDELQPIVERFLQYAESPASPCHPAVTLSHNPMDQMYPAGGFPATKPPAVKRTQQ